MTNVFKSPVSTIALVGALAIVSGCAPESGVGQFYREAGTQLDQGEFGNATLHNQLAQICNRGGGYKTGKAGSSLGDPVVVLDPTSTPGQPIYRVHCEGKLDGKYALVNYNEYIGSSVQKTTVEDASGS